MEEVVTDGTAKRAQIAGYTVAGKTGTAQKLVNGQYSHSDHYASFVGFVPSRNPVFAIVVVIDSAKGPNGDHGGTVAAPIFKNIAEPALRYLGVPLTVNPPSPVLVARHDDSEGHTPTERRRAEPAPWSASSPTDHPARCPTCSGMSARDAVRTLVKLGMNARVSGDGFVVSQVPAAGAPIDGDAVCRLVLERWPSRHVVTASRP